MSVPSKSYEVRIQCDSCGASVDRLPVDESHYLRMVQLEDPQLEVLAPETTQIAVGEREPGGPETTEVYPILQHVEICSCCPGYSEG